MSHQEYCHPTHTLSLTHTPGSIFLPKPLLCSLVLCVAHREGQRLGPTLRLTGDKIVQKDRTGRDEGGCRGAGPEQAPSTCL